ncbi:MAG: hypothetical protein H6853_06855 [Rhodospirillales bacterium]|nr:hypothetical protein [Alphaproteobacteria bacterium]USO03247.1 MAG: hypothetical protein H6853_06855 [Rhodospirillales bacterium]
MLAKTQFEISVFPVENVENLGKVSFKSRVSALNGPQLNAAIEREIAFQMQRQHPEASGLHSIWVDITGDPNSNENLKDYSHTHFTVRGMAYKF